MKMVKMHAGWYKARDDEADTSISPVPAEPPPWQESP